MDQTGRVVDLVAKVLGPNVIGTYLHGSAVQTGLRPASDLDVLVVVERSLSDTERQVLTDGLLDVSGMSDALRPVELLVPVREQIVPWRYPATADYLYGEWLRAEFEAGTVPRPEPMPDLASLLTVARRCGQALNGPPPTDVLPAVPHADLLRSCADGVPELLAELEDDTRNVVLTLARTWTTLATGEIRSKDAAAEWALERLPVEFRPLLAHARRLYVESSYADETWSDDLLASLQAYADHVVAEIDALRP